MSRGINDPCLQVVRDHHLGLECIWDAHPPNSAASNGASCPEKEPFTTWKFRSDGASKRTIDFIWCEWLSSASCALPKRALALHMHLVWK